MKITTCEDQSGVVQSFYTESKHKHTESVSSVIWTFRFKIAVIIECNGHSSHDHMTINGLLSLLVYFDRFNLSSSPAPNSQYLKSHDSDSKSELNMSRPDVLRIQGHRLR